MSHPHQKHTGASQAMYAVRWAQVSGELRPPTDFACTDCGRPAEVYDHRDYNRPLDVEPVCHSCNQMRGAAVPSDMGDPPTPRSAKESTGFVLSKYGIAQVSFDAVDFYPKGRKKVAAWRSLCPEIEQLPLAADGMQGS